MGCVPKKSRQMAPTVRKDTQVSTAFPSHEQAPEEKAAFTVELKEYMTNGR